MKKIKMKQFKKILNFENWVKLNEASIYELRYLENKTYFKFRNLSGVKKPVAEFLNKLFQAGIDTESLYVVVGFGDACGFELTGTQPETETPDGNDTQPAKKYENFKKIVYSTKWGNSSSYAQVLIMKKEDWIESGGKNICDITDKPIFLLQAPKSILKLITALPRGKNKSLINASDYEAGIAYAFNMLYALENETPENIKEKTGITDKNWELKWNEIQEKCINFANKLSQFVDTKVFMKVYGGKKVKTSKEWASGNSLPKTDIIQGDVRYSLKQAGQSQLISSTNEAKSVLKAALLYMNKYEPGAFKQNIENIITEIENHFKNIKLKGESVDNLKKQIAELWSVKRYNELLPKSKRKFSSHDAEAKVINHINAELIHFGIKNFSEGYTNYLVNEWTINEDKFLEWLQNKLNSEKDNDLSTIAYEIAETTLVHKKIEQKIKEILQNNPAFTKWLIYEAATGLYKFTGQIDNLNVKDINVANAIMVFDRESGFIEIKKINPAWAATNIENISVGINFKTHGGKTSSSFRVYQQTKLTEGVAALTHYKQNNRFFKLPVSFKSNKKIEDGIKNILKDFVIKNIFGSLKIKVNNIDNATKFRFINFIIGSIGKAKIKIMF